MTLLLGALFVSSSLSLELRALDQQLEFVENRLSDIAAERELLRIEAGRVESKLTVARLHYEEALEQYKKRIRALERAPRSARLALLGDTEGMEEYLRVARLLRLVARADHRIAIEFQKESERVQNLERTVAQNARELDRLESKIRQERDVLSDLRTQKLKWVQNQLASKKGRATLLRETARASKNLLDWIRASEPAARLRQHFGANKGRLPWPSLGPIVAGFDESTELNHGTRTHHSGLDFASQVGSPVQSVAPGDVVFAAWMNGYGNLVIVDHGQGYHSLYAHLRSLGVRAGDAVNVGGLLGEVGDSGSFRGTLLYFELRKDGVAIDPRPWLR